MAEMTHKANHSEAGETRHFDAQVLITNEDFFSRSQVITLVDLFKSPAHSLSMKSNAIRTSIDLPRDLHRRVHEAAARKGCSARKLILAGIDAWLLAVADAAEGILVTFDKALASQGVNCLLPKRGESVKG